MYIVTPLCYEYHCIPNTVSQDISGISKIYIVQRVINSDIFKHMIENIKLVTSSSSTIR